MPNMYIIRWLEIQYQKRQTPGADWNPGWESMPTYIQYMYTIYV